MGQYALKVHVWIEFEGEKHIALVLLSYLNGSCLICVLETAESFLIFASKHNLQSWFDNFECNSSNCSNSPKVNIVVAKEGKVKLLDPLTSLLQTRLNSFQYQNLQHNVQHDG